MADRRWAAINHSHAGGAGMGAMDDLTDVDTTGVAANDLLYFDGANWVDSGGLLQWNGSTLFVYDATKTDYLAFNDSGSVAKIETNNNPLNLAVPGARIISGGYFRIYDSTNADYIYEYHDGTDFNTEFVGTTDWNVTDLTNFNLLEGMQLRVAGPTNVGQLVLAHNDTDLNITNVTTTDWNIIGMTGYVWIRDGAGLKISDAADTDHVTMTHNGTDFNILGTNTTGLDFESFSNIEFRNGAIFRIRDTTNADIAAFSHDGTDFNTAFTTTTDWNINGGVTLKLWDSSGTDFFGISHTGTNAQFWTQNTTDINVTSLAGAFWLRDGAGLKISDSADTDWALFSHDGTDFNNAYVNTARVTQSGATSMDFEGGMTFRMLDGGNVQIFDATDTDWIRFRHDGSAGRFEAVNTTHLYFQDLTTGIVFDDGMSTFHRDASQTNYMQMYHDGTDFYFNSNSTVGDVHFETGITGDIILQGQAIEHSFGNKDADAVQQTLWPRGGEFSVDSATQTGAIRIELDAGFQNTMVWLRISGYTYDSGSGNPGGPWEVLVGGYAYTTTPTWINCGAHLIAGYPPFSKVKFQVGTTNEAFIQLGVTTDVWEYPQINVEVLSEGFGAHAATTPSITITQETTETAIGSTPHEQFVWALNENVNANTYERRRLPTGATGTMWLDGWQHFIYDSANTDYLQIYHSGTYATINESTNGGIDFQLGGGLEGGIRANWWFFSTPLKLLERSASQTDSAGYGQFWVQDDAPNRPYFTDDAGNDYPLQFAKALNVSEDASDTCDWQYMNGIYFKDGTAGITLTLEASGVTTFEVGAMTQIVNAHASTGDITVTEGTGTTLYVLDGATVTDSAGSSTVGPGGYATLYRHSATVYYLFGAGITV